MKFSCKGCTKRTVGCHATCETYIKEKAENDRAREEEHKHSSHLIGAINSNGTYFSGKNPRH